MIYPEGDMTVAPADVCRATAISSIALSVRIQSTKRSSIQKTIWKSTAQSRKPIWTTSFEPRSGRSGRTRSYRDFLANCIWRYRVGSGTIPEAPQGHTRRYGVYISTSSRRATSIRYLSASARIALLNLEKIYASDRHIVQAVFICGTDLGRRLFILFCKDLQ